jgi:hypothetical protein
MSRPRRNCGTTRRSQIELPSSFLQGTGQHWGSEMAQAWRSRTFTHVHLATTFSDDAHDLGMGHSRSDFESALIEGLK